jgi:hypothetical protein
MIEHDDCLRVLASDEIGQLAVVASNTAIVVPVNYPLYGHVGAFPTDEHSMQDEYLASPTGGAHFVGFRSRPSRHAACW